MFIAVSTLTAEKTAQSFVGLFANSVSLWSLKKLPPQLIEVSPKLLRVVMIYSKQGVEQLKSVIGTH